MFVFRKPGSTQLSDSVKGNNASHDKLTPSWVERDRYYSRKMSGNVESISNGASSWLGEIKSSVWVWRWSITIFMQHYGSIVPSQLMMVRRVQMSTVSILTLGNYKHPATVHFTHCCSTITTIIIFS